MNETSVKTEANRNLVGIEEREFRPNVLETLCDLVLLLFWYKTD